MTAAAFSSALGTVGGVIVTVCLAMFTFTTACAQIEFGCATLSRLIGSIGRYGRWIMLGLIFCGGIVGIEALINYLDFALFLTIFFNLIGVYRSSGEVVEATEEYFADTGRWESEKWPKWAAMTAAYEAKTITEDGGIVYEMSADYRNHS